MTLHETAQLYVVAKTIDRALDMLEQDEEGRCYNDKALDYLLAAREGLTDLLSR